MTASASANDLLKAKLAAAEARYVERNPTSKKLHETAVDSLPGGNTRTLLHTAPFPLVMKSGKGTFLWDEDGHRYTDFVAEMTAGIYGHSHPAIRAAVVATLDGAGMNLGATTVQEQRYAALVCTRFGLARMRFANSGTEANLHALGAARAFTGRRKVLVFSGAYHGAVLAFPVVEGRRHDEKTGAYPLPQNNVDRADWVVGRYNDTDGARRLMATFAADLAAVLVEGMQGSGGCIPGAPDFLLAVRDAARSAGALFILDEVMTSRVAPGGLQSTPALKGLDPDLTTLGKYLGGGFASGAFGGRADVMAVYDPRARGALAHSGTFNNNTVAMHAGFAGLTEALTPAACVALNAAGDALRERLAALCRGTKMAVTGVGSLMAVHFSDAGTEGKNIRCVEDVRARERPDIKDLFWFEMMEQGFWITRRGSVSLILDTPDEELDRFVGCVGQFLERHEEIVRLK